MSKTDKSDSIARSSAIMALGTLTSRLLGMVRTSLVVAALGATASGAGEAFNAANNLPNELYTLIIGGPLNAILVPQIVQALRRRNGEELVNRLLTAASVAMAVVTAVVTLAAPLVITFYASGLGKWQPLGYAFAFWCMPQIFFYGLGALWGQVLNARSRFGPPLWSPVLNNIIAIASLLAYLHVYGGYTPDQDPGIWDAGRIALVGGTATAGIAAQALILYIPLVRSGFRPRFVWGVRGLGLWTMSKVALWALAGTGVVALGSIATSNLGSRAVTMAQTPQYADQIVPSKVLYDNAYLVYILPQSLVVTSIVTALFTRMSEKAAANDRKGVRDDLSLGLRSVAVFNILFAAGIGTLSAPAIQLFTPALSAEQAAAGAPILTVLAIGIIFQGIWFTTQRVMLAYADTKRLLIADTVVGIVPVIVCLGAYLLAPPPHWMAWAAAGSMLSQLGGSVTVIPLARRHLPDLDGARVLKTYGRLLLAAVPAILVGAGIQMLLGPADGSLTGVRFFDALVTVLLAAVLMTVAYLVAARLLHVEELGVLFVPLSRIIAKVGRLLPGRAGEAVEHLAHVLAPTSADRAGIQLPPSYPPAYYRTMLRAVDAPRPAPAPPPTVPAPPPTYADLAAQAASFRALSTGTLAPHGLGLFGTGGGALMTDATPIGTGRYALAATLPATLPRVVRHVGRDTILDRTVTVLMLTEATPHRDEVLESASRAVLVEDSRIQRVFDVETDHPSFIVTEPADGRPLSALVSQGLSAAQVRAIVGEVAQALDACSRRGLHHLNLSPDSVRLRPDGSVQVTGVGIEAAILGLDEQAASDPLSADKTDARALVEMLYYGLTGRWPGKRAGLPSAPTTSTGAPVPPSGLAKTMGPDDAGLDELVARTWSGQEPSSASQVADALLPWDTSVLPRTAVESVPDADATAAAPEEEPVLRGVISRLRKASAARPTPPAVVAEPEPAPGDAAAVESSVSEAPTGFEWQPTASAAQGVPSGQGEPQPVGLPAAVPPEPAQDSTHDVLTPGFDFTAPPSITPSSAAEAAISEEDEEVSRSISRTTKVIVVSMVLIMLLGVFFAVRSMLGLADVRFTDDDVPAAKTVPTAAAPTQGGQHSQAPATTAAPTAPITVTGARAVDIGGEGDHPELAGTLTDGNPSSEWYSQRYNTAAFGNLKQGTGVAVSLEQAASISGIDLQGTGQGGNVQIRSTSPDDPAGGTLLAEGPFTPGTTSFSFAPTSAQSVVVWVTSLPTASDGLNKATISEITLK